MASRQEYFTLLSHGKQADGTGGKFSTGNHLTICKHSVAFSQAVRMGLEPSQIQQAEEVSD